MHHFLVLQQHNLKKMLISSCQINLVIECNQSFSSINNIYKKLVSTLKHQYVSTKNDGISHKNLRSDAHTNTNVKMYHGFNTLRNLESF